MNRSLFKRPYQIRSRPAERLSHTELTLGIAVLITRERDYIDYYQAT